MLALLLFSANAGTIWSFAGHPYTAAAPKKLFLQRTVRHGTGAGVNASWDVASIDSVPARAALPHEIRNRAAAAAPGAWLALSPVSNVLQARSLLSYSPHVLL